MVSAVLNEEHSVSFPVISSCNDTLDEEFLLYDSSQGDLE